MKTNNLIILNDMGGGVMYVSEDTTGTLRAQMKHHEPIICFEPGIVKREGNDSRFVNNMCGTLRADMGDNQPAVCYAKPDEKTVYVFKERAGCPGGGKGILIAENRAFTIATNFNGAICYEADNRH